MSKPFIAFFKFVDIFISLSGLSKCVVASTTALPLFLGSSDLNIQDKNITEEVANMLLSNITQSIPETTDINNINFLDYKK